MMKSNLTSGLALAIALACAGNCGAENAKSYYAEPPLFSTAPDEGKSLSTIERFGPVGMSIELHQPAFTMWVGTIEPGSPAEAAGGLKKGQVIESINGESLKDIDPRIQLGRIIEKAEATDGIVKFAIKGEASPVIVKIPVLGSYSKTWPLDCPKSDKIVRQFADYLAKPGNQKGFADIGMLFLLSTGEDKDIAPVREWVHGMIGKEPSPYAWVLGFGGIPLCEYYLRTGDSAALPVIQKWVDVATRGEYLDGWAGRGGVCAVTYGNGHLNAGGTAVVTFLMLAKECGANVNDSLLQRVLVHFFRYAGRGTNPYGDDRPETSFVDNGKNGNLAFAMAAAASLTPEGENSIYAKARDISAMTSFYTTTHMLHGHTGGGIGELWRSSAMGLLAASKPAQYREFMDGRRWHYELSRRFDGTFAILGGARYDNPEWGAGYALTYTIPRKTLRITGAASPFAKPFQLPKRPWGTPADDVFQSMEPAAGMGVESLDLAHETIAKDSGVPMIRGINAENEVSDDTIRKLASHPQYIIRHMIGNHAAGLTAHYIAPKPGKRVRAALIEEFCRHQDPRVRNTGLRAAAVAFDPSAEWCRRLFDLAIERLKDPEESWWVKDAALSLVAKGTPEMIVPHAELLVSYLTHPEQWLQNGALTALTEVMTDERCYRTVIPAIGELLRTCQRYSTTGGPVLRMREILPTAGPDVRKLASSSLSIAFEDYAGVRTWEGGQNVASVYESHLEIMAGALASVPGGLDVLYQIASKRYPREILPYKEFFLNADPEQSGPEMKQAITSIITGELIPEYVGRNRVKLRELAAAEAQNFYFPDTIDGLVSLYDRAGQRDYDWRMFADLNEAEWSYHSFDPIPAEQVPLDRLVVRYRKVTLPPGMENWYDPGFDPDQAGWKRGRSPFGNYDGRIPVGLLSKCTEQCTGGNCYGSTKVNTLWEKEVLLLRGTFKVPPFRDGHRYRLRVNQRSHVGNGTGYAVYVNGRKLIENPNCIGRGGGGKPYGAYLTKEFFDDFKGGDVTIAAMGFLRYNDKYNTTPVEPVPQGRISVHIDEQKLPPMGDDLVRRSAAVIPMTSSAWQAAQGAESDEDKQAGHMFRWDGKLVPNPAALGSWKVVSVVPTLDEFVPGKAADLHRAPFQEITLRENGGTDSESLVWSGDTLMHLDRFEALKMQTVSLQGTDSLVIEAGGFSARNPAGWKPMLVVMQRK
jgi:hypothetical protein